MGLPYKVLSNLRISALMDQYPVSIDVNEQSDAHHCSFALEGRGGTTYTFLLGVNAPALHIHADGANLGAINRGLRTVSVTFPDGPAYSEEPVTFSW